MTRAIKRGSRWAPLSAEARDLIAMPERDGLRWGYVTLACGEAAQLGAFGVARRAPDLFTDLEPEPLPVPDPAQADFGF